MKTLILLEPFNYMWDIVANYSYNCLGIYLEYVHKSSPLSRLQFKDYGNIEMREEIATKIRKGERFTIGPSNIDPFRLCEEFKNGSFVPKNSVGQYAFTLLDDIMDMANTSKVQIKVLALMLGKSEEESIQITEEYFAGKFPFKPIELKEITFEPAQEDLKTFKNRLLQFLNYFTSLNNLVKTICQMEKSDALLSILNDYNSFETGQMNDKLNEHLKVSETSRFLLKIGLFEAIANSYFRMHAILNEIALFYGDDINRLNSSAGSFRQWIETYVDKAFVLKVEE